MQVSVTPGLAALLASLQSLLKTDVPEGTAMPLTVILSMRLVPLPLEALASRFTKRTITRDLLLAEPPRLIEFEKPERETVELQLPSGAPDSGTV